MALAGGGHETLIFVDVDGVLNVGIKDTGSTPVQLEERGCEFAESTYREGRSEQGNLVEKVFEVMKRRAGGDMSSAPLRAYACRNGELCSDILVARLADIVSTAVASVGGAVQVVLASNWRRPKHAKTVKKFEEQLSRHLNRPFVFDATTREGDERNAADRLRCIGDFVRDRYGATEKAAAGGLAVPAALMVLVLDDFFITPMRGWECDGTAIQSIDDAEAYLRGCTPPSTKVSALILHPYDEWSSRCGTRIQVGVGLTEQHCSQAAAFLGSATSAAAAEQEQHRRRLTSDFSTLEEEDDSDHYGCC